MNSSSLARENSFFVFIYLANELNSNSSLGSISKEDKVFINKLELVTIGKHT